MSVGIAVNLALVLALPAVVVGAWILDQLNDARDAFEDWCDRRAERPTPLPRAVALRIHLERELPDTPTSSSRLRAIIARLRGLARGSH